ncbi:hypothetical protein WJX82_011738 [Trebouxia sp. C0006]
MGAWFQAGQLARCIGGVPAVHKGCVPAPQQSHLQILLSHLECCVCLEEDRSWQRRHRSAFQMVFKMYHIVAGLDCSQLVLEVRREQQQQTGHKHIRPARRNFPDLRQQLI